ncbi:MAG: rane protein [Acidimicrobiales bacterium]|nr:rane protein [Acidimicrobiales bacterium]
MARPSSAQALAGFLAGAGVMHFVQPDFFDAIVPKALPNPRFWTNLSGVAELAVAAAVAVPRTRRLGATAAAVLFASVFPANIQAALDAQPGVERAITYARLPLQVPLGVWALRVRRAT